MPDFRMLSVAPPVVAVEDRVFDVMVQEQEKQEAMDMSALTAKEKFRAQTITILGGMVRALWNSKGQPGGEGDIGAAMSLAKASNIPFTVARKQIGDDYRKTTLPTFWLSASAAVYKRTSNGPTTDGVGTSFA